MPVLPENAFSFCSLSPDQTRRLGMGLGAQLRPGDVVCLQGELGAGKTTFVQGLAAGWGSIDAVSSPTFLIVNVYRQKNGGQLFHFDTYRVESPEEAEELDLDAMLSSGPLVIEWPERMENLLPNERLWIKLEYTDTLNPLHPNQEPGLFHKDEGTLSAPSDERRELTFLPVGKHYVELLDEFCQSTFGTDDIIPITGVN